MKNFKEWFTDKVSKQTTKVLVPLKMRMKLQQPFYALTDERFLKAKVAEDEDVDSIVIIERLCYNGQTPWTRSAIMHEIRYNKNAFYIVVYDETQPVAFIGAWFVDGEAHITNIATIPDYQNKGIASYLIKEIITLAHAEDMKKLTLEVRVSNHTAQSLYRTLGFKDGNIKKNYYANDYEDALEMTLPLYPHQRDVSEWK